MDLALVKSLAHKGGHYEDLTRSLAGGFSDRVISVTAAAFRGFPFASIRP